MSTCNHLLARWSIGAVLLALAASGYAGCLRTWGPPPSTIPFPSELENVLAISASGVRGLALLPDGNVRYWGAAGAASVVPGSATNVTAIAAGVEHCVVARGDGSVVSWGRSDHGQTTPPADATNIVAVSAGERFSAALRGDGTVVTWGKWYTGDTGDYETIPAISLTDVIAISAGDNHLMVLRENGEVQCFGAYSQGQSQPPDGLTDVIAISAGRSRSLALKRNGTVVAWGLVPGFPYLTPTGIKAIAAGTTHDVALKENGTVITWGSNPPSVPYDLADVTAVDAGDDYSVALLRICEAPTLETPAAAPGSTVCAGTAVTLTQPATGGTEPYAYQWLSNGVPVAGATGSTFEVTSPVDRDEFSCTVSSSCGVERTSEALVLRVNAVPTAPDHTCVRTAGTSQKIRAADIAANLVFFSVGASAQSATIAFDADNIYYQPQPGNNNSDTFTYTTSNGQCFASGTITINVESAGGMARQIAYGAEGVTIRFYGIPGISYDVQRSSELDFSSYETVLTTNAPAGGEFSYTEPGPASGSAFYRLMH